MRYSTKQNLAAVLSIISAMSGFIILIKYDNTRISSSRFIFVYFSFAVILAMISAYISITIKRIHEKKLKQKHIFIIHSSQDKDLVLRISKILRDYGLKPWSPMEQLLPGQHINNIIFSAIEESLVALVVVSPNLENNIYAQEELKHALNHLTPPSDAMSPVIPIIFQDGRIPETLKGIMGCKSETDLQTLANILANLHSDSPLKA